MKLTTNFDIDEFRCQDGTPVPAVYLHNVRELAFNLQVLRDEINKPIIISSGYRTVEHNRKTPNSAKNSKHLLAQAADIKVKGMKPKAVYDIIEKLIEQGKMKQGGLKAYKTFVHYDVRGTKARW